MTLHMADIGKPQRERTVEKPDRETPAPVKQPAPPVKEPVPA